MLRLAPMTASPLRRNCGKDSPVRIASSTLEMPSCTNPSAGMVSPGRTSTLSPGTSSTAGTSSSAPLASRRCALAGRTWPITSAASAARFRAVNSKVRAPSSKNTNMQTESKYTSPLPLAVASVLALKARVMPRATGRSIPALRLVISRQAEVKNGRAEYNSTGRVSSRLSFWKKSR